MDEPGTKRSEHLPADRDGRMLAFPGEGHSTMSRYARFTAFPQVGRLLGPSSPQGITGAGDVADTAASTIPEEGTR